MKYRDEFSTSSYLKKFKVVTSTESELQSEDQIQPAPWFIWLYIAVTAITKSIALTIIRKKKIMFCFFLINLPCEFVRFTANLYLSTVLF